MSADITIPEIQAHWRVAGFHAPEEWPEGSLNVDWVWTEEGPGTLDETGDGLFAWHQTYVSRFYVQPVGQSIDQGKRRARELRRQAGMSLKTSYHGGTFDDTLNGAVDGTIPPYDVSEVAPSPEGGEGIDWWIFSITINVIESQ